MFVPHSPDMVYDVERHSDRCVCGCSALATCHDYNSVNCGYCDSCAKKRTDFVNDITGVISVGEENSFEYVEVVGGLKEGERVIVSDMNRNRDRERLKIR